METAKRILEHVRPLVQDFATKLRGTVSQTDNEINCRVRGSTGMVTVQVLITGRIGEHKLEITKIGGSGIEGYRSRIQIPEDLQQLNMNEVTEALRKAF